MVTNRVLRAAAVAVTSVGLIVGVTGIAGAATGSGSIFNTGPDSTNKIITKDKMHANVTNNNTLSLDNSTSQSAYTGDAKVKHNTTGGDASTGDATNSTSLGVTVDISNSMPPMQGGGSGGNATDASIDTTGPDSLNLVVTKNSTQVNVTNNNTISLSNNVSQSATSGDARVSGNTTGGDAMTGSASNTANATFSLTVSN